MTPWLIYGAITVLTGLLFGWLLWRQNKRVTKRWLIAKIQQDTPQKDDYIKALKQLDKQPTHSSKTTLWLLLALIPTALLLNAYLFPPQSQQQTQQAPSIEEALAQLEQALQDNPNDLEGQMLYARAMMSMQNFEAAVNALRKANELSPNNANILTELAEAVAFKNDTGSFLGEPEQLIDAALAADPEHQKALWLQGIIAYEQKDYAKAEQLWTTLMYTIRDEKVKVTILKQVNQARQQQSKPALSQSDFNQQSQQSIQAKQGYHIIVNADQDIKKQQFPATTRLFVSAKALTGPPMPVAAVDLAPPFNWPLTVHLSDQHNLTPERRLSDFDAVILSARLSVSGDAGVSDYKSQSKTVQEQQKPVQLALTQPDKVK